MEYVPCKIRDSALLVLLDFDSACWILEDSSTYQHYLEVCLSIK